MVVLDVLVRMYILYCIADPSSPPTFHFILLPVRSHQLSSVLCTVVLVGAFSFVPYVDWAAHLGGFIAGLCVGLFIFSFWIQHRICFILWCCLGIAVTVLFYTLGLEYMYKVEPNKDLEDVCTYYKQYFEDYVCHCRLQVKGGR